MYEVQWLPGPLPVVLVALGVALEKRLLIYTGVGLYAGALALTYYVGARVSR